MTVPPVPRRQRALLDALLGRSEPATVQDLAELTGRHPTTVRAHLQELESAGLVRAMPQRDGARGRPRLFWYAVRPVEIALADLATELVADLRARDGGLGDAAYQAGRRMVRGTVDDVDDLRVLMTRLGFDPVEDEETPTTMWFRSCPYARVVAHAGTEVCAMHEGLTDAALESGSGPADRRAVIDPLVEPGLCRLRLVPRDGS
ncbi:MAG: helix-turn-helix transcriptional regulator [Actinomycetaceae bacterium]